MTWTRKSTASMESSDVKASAGDRRAIADADQTGQLDISGGAKAARSPRTLRTTHRRCEDGTTTRQTFHSEIGAHSVVASRGRSSPHRRVVGEQDGGYSAEIPDGLHCSFEHLQRSKTQPCITFVETRFGVVCSFMCARKGGYEDLTKEILRHF